MGILHTLLSFLASQNALSAGDVADDRLEDALEAWHDGRAEAAGFTNEWVVRMDGNGDEVDLLALKLGFKNLGEVNCLSDLNALLKSYDISPL
jgi:hypothetical protein